MSDTRFNELILQRLDEIVELLNAQIRSDWLTTREVALYLRCSKRQVDKLTSEGLLPYHRLDPNKPKSHRLFHRKHLDIYLATGKNCQKQRLTATEKRMVEVLL